MKRFRGISRGGIVRRIAMLMLFRAFYFDRGN